MRIRNGFIGAQQRDRHLPVTVTEMLVTMQAFHQYRDTDAVAIQVDEIRHGFGFIQLSGIEWIIPRATQHIK
jgi:hypothetical protein